MIVNADARLVRCDQSPIYLACAFKPDTSRFSLLVIFLSETDALPFVLLCAGHPGFVQFLTEYEPSIPHQMLRAFWPSWKQIFLQGVQT